MRIRPTTHDKHFEYNGLTLELNATTKAKKTGYDEYGLVKLCKFLMSLRESYVLIRPIIHLKHAPRDITTNALLSDFLDRYKKLLGNYIRKESRFKKYKNAETLHFWCLEKNKDGTWHYHAYLLIPRKVFLSEFTPRDIFEQAFTNFNEKHGGLLGLQWPEKSDEAKQKYPDVAVINPSSEDSMRRAFTLMSYCIKVHTKEQIVDKRRFGSSNVKSVGKGAETQPIFELKQCA